MTLVNLDDVIKRAKALTAEEQRQLRDALNASLAAAQLPTEDEFERELLRAGLLSELPAATADAADDSFQPIPNKGKPLSEVILEERR